MQESVWRTSFLCVNSFPFYHISVYTTLSLCVCLSWFVKKIGTEIMSALVFRLLFLMPVMQIFTIVEPFICNICCKRQSQVLMCLSLQRGIFYQSVIKFNKILYLYLRSNIRLYFKQFFLRFQDGDEEEEEKSAKQKDSKKKKNLGRRSTRTRKHISYR